MIQDIFWRKKLVPWDSPGVPWASNSRGCTPRILKITFPRSFRFIKSPHTKETCKTFQTAENNSIMVCFIHEVPPWIAPSFHSWDFSPHLRATVVAPDTWAYKISSQTPTKEWVAATGFEPAPVATGHQRGKIPAPYPLHHASLPDGNIILLMYWVYVQQIYLGPQNGNVLTYFVLLNQTKTT